MIFYGICHYDFENIGSPHEIFENIDSPHVVIYKQKDICLVFSHSPFYQGQIIPF